MESDISYPTLRERFKAIVLDGFIILIGLVVAGVIFGQFPNAPGYVRGAVFVLVFLLYEPILVSTGGTVGHRVFGIRVKSYADYSRNVMIPFAIIRSVVKWILSWLSFFTMLSNPEKRAIHDLLSGSIVLYREDAEGEESE
ncbi:MAG: RDD family protein [Candidatus Kapaibacterium sp.]